MNDETNLNYGASNENYQERIDRKVSELMNEWWFNLSKEDLLEYIRDNKAITADMLRTLFGEQDVVIEAGLSFSTKGRMAQIDFNGESEPETSYVGVLS